MILQHCSGSKHSKAEGLSRIPDRAEFCDCYQAGVDVESLPCYPCSFCSRAQAQWSRFENDVDDVVPLAVRSVTTAESDNGFQIRGYSHEQLVEFQAKDFVIQRLLTWVLTDTVQEQSEISLCSPAIKHFYINRERLVSCDNLLYNKWEHSLRNRLLFMVPKKPQTEVMSLNHDLLLTGHMEIKKTLARVQRSYMWYKMSSDVELFVKTCKVCSKNKKATVKHKASLGMYHQCSPMERVHIDILGPFTPSAGGNQYFLMMVDQFTKWLECFPLPYQNAEETAWLMS